MRMIYARRWLVLIVACLCPVLTVVAAPQWVSETWEDFRDYHELHQTLKKLLDERSEMEEESTILKNRIQIKETVLDRIDTGSLSLKMAAKQYLSLDEDRHYYTVNVCQPVRVGSELELAAITVIRHLRCRTHSAHPLQADTLARMDREFESEFGYLPPKE